MKKCASCTKDLPDAALHCVFCGAKQPPAPATAGGVAKTVLGSYQASDVIEHMRGRPSPAPMPAAQPFPAPRPTPGPPPGIGASTPAYQGGAPMPAVPPASVAPTMFVPGSNPPGPAPHQGPTQIARPSAPVASPVAQTIAAPAPHMGPGMGPGPMGPGPMGPGPMGPGPGPMGPRSQPISQPPPPLAPMAPPMGAPNYHPASQPPPFAHVNTAARIGRPIEPWKDTLRLMMFIWGAALLVAFAVPTVVDPLAFSWDTILNGKGTEKLPPLIMAAVGLLSIAIAGIPTSPAPRGMFAAMLGLTGVLVPLFLPGMPDWKVLASLGGMFLLLPGLFLRTEYRESIAPRVMITLGVLACLAMFLVPENGEVPLVNQFDHLVHAPGKAKIDPILTVTYIALLVLTLLAWLPSPSTGGAIVFAWVLIAWPVIVLLTSLLVSDSIGPAISKTPGRVLQQAIAGGGIAFMAGVAYAVLIGYGIATLVGKKLE